MVQRQRQDRIRNLSLSEEFNDVIAEGLHRLIHQGADVADAKQTHWQGVLERRFQQIDGIAARLLRDRLVVGRAMMPFLACRRWIGA
jgi:hypothetical protein